MGKTDELGTRQDGEMSWKVGGPTVELPGRHWAWRSWTYSGFTQICPPSESGLELLLCGYSFQRDQTWAFMNKLKYSAPFVCRACSSCTQTSSPCVKGRDNVKGLWFLCSQCKHILDSPWTACGESRGSGKVKVLSKLPYLSALLEFDFDMDQNCRCGFR